MRADTLKLINFRNFSDKHFSFTPEINLIHAPNGRGKTNILESLRIMSYGRPIFGTRDTDIINFKVAGGDLPFTKIFLHWHEKKERESIFTLSPKMKPVKTLLIDDVKKTPRNFTGVFSTVWFSPETINLITSSPRNRRELLDAYFCQLSIDYTIALMDFQKALEARNKVLKVQDRSYMYKYLPKYDEILIKYSLELINQKNILAEQLRQEVVAASTKQSRYEINWTYEPNVAPHPIFDENIEFLLAQNLHEMREKDIATKRTSVGPHKDNWTLTLRDLSSSDRYDLRHYGSRGQKRMGLLIFTLAIVSLLEKAKGSKPVLLLDDVVSELDAENVDLILNMLHNTGQQSIITSTHNKIDGLDKANVISLD